MTIAVYAGSFDPFTRGHLDITRKATQCFSSVIVAVPEAGGNAKKTTLFDTQERIELILGALPGDVTVIVMPFKGLLVDFCRQIWATVLVRGLRAVTDFDQEMAIAHANRSMTSQINTVFFPTEPEHSFISSSTVKELARHQSEMAQSSLDQYVTSNVRDALQRKFAHLHG